MSTTTKRQLSTADSERIKCQTQDCEDQATVTHQVEWDTGNTKGISFFYHCEKHTDNTRGD